MSFADASVLAERLGTLPGGASVGLASGSVAADQLRSEAGPIVEEIRTSLAAIRPVVQSAMDGALSVPAPWTGWGMALLVLAGSTAIAVGSVLVGQRRQQLPGKFRL